MAITLADFNKIWSSASPLSPYTFSDDNYNEGWNFIGQIPPSRQMWDFLQKNNDEKMQYLANNYLPLSGGSLTGNLGFNGSGGAFITRNINNNRLEIMGGTAWNTSASLVLSGKDRDGGVNGGIFELYASIDNNPKKLVGKPNGTLTWDGNRIDFKTVTLTQEVTFDFNNGNIVSVDTDGNELKFDIPTGGTKIISVTLLSGTTNSLSLLWYSSDTVVKYEQMYIGGTKTPTTTVKCLMIYI